MCNAVNRQIREMRRPSGENGLKEGEKVLAPVRERELRYRIEVEMLPKSGVLRVADEYLAALNAKVSLLANASLLLKGRERRYTYDWRGRHTLPTMIVT